MVMREDCEFYICPICFAISEEAAEHHDQPMIFCKTLDLSWEQLKPIITGEGELKSRAPKWFMQSVRSAAGIDYPENMANDPKGNG